MTSADRPVLDFTGQRPQRVAVLGAGLAGLRAATELTRSGLAVRVYEARSEVGGRARGEWCAGHWMDSAWPVLGGRDAALARWAREIEVGDLLSPLRPVQTALLRNGEKIPVESLSLRGAARIPGPPVWERAKLLRWGRLMGRYASQLDASFPERAADLDYRSLRDHVALYFGRGALEFWITPEIQGVYGDSVEGLSRVALLLHARSLGIGERRPGLPGLPRRPLLELAQTAAEPLDIRRGTGVQRVDELPSGGFSIETIDAEGARDPERFDAVVLALGPSEAARVTSSLLTPAERDFFGEVRERPVVNLSVALDGIHTGLPQEIRIPRREGSAISSIVIEPGQSGGRAPEGKSQLVVRARDAFATRWSDVAGDVVAKNLLSSLELAMSGIGERVLTTHLGRSMQASFEVGSYRQLANFQQVQLDRRALGRRLYWAGDYLAGPSFESATRSGLRAALALATDLAENG
jgi:protoporphyrinogen oxidase